MDMNASGTSTLLGGSSSGPRFPSVGFFAKKKEEGVPLDKDRGGGWAECVRRRVPVLRWAPQYDRTAAVADLVAGLTLGLTLVPQSIAYASLANMPVQYGLYSAFMGTIVYAFLGSVKEVSIGPTSLMALLTLQTCRDLPVPFVVLLTFLSGCVVFVMGLLRLGFLVDLISPSVTSGFTSATALIVIGAQVKGLLGLSFVAESLLENAQLIVRNFHRARLPDCLLSLVCCSVLLALRKLKDLPVNPKRRKLKKTLWLISISRNALVVFAASTVAYCTYDPTAPLFKLSGRVEQGVPRLALPAFSATLGNRTLAFPEMVAELGTGVLMLPIVMVLANIAIAKAFSAGGQVDATQEMLALGLCNVAGSLARALPSAGAFTRSAVADCSGVRSPLASLYSGLITLLALNFLTQYFFFIPKACLSSVLICAVVFMIDVQLVVRLMRAERAEAGVALVTVCVGVWRSVELAVLCGAAAALAAALRPLLRPPVHADLLETYAGEVCRVRPTRALLYANAERFEARALAAAAAARTAASAPAPGPGPGPAPALLVDCSALMLLDYSAAQVMGRMITKLEAVEQQVIFYNASADVAARLERVRGLDARPLRARTAAAALRAALAPAPPPPPPPPAPPAPPAPAAPEAAALLQPAAPHTEEV